VADQPEPVADPDNGHRIGPNAIVRVVEALSVLEDDAASDTILAGPPFDGYRRHGPDAMVPEAHVTALQAALYEHLPAARARAVNLEAGRLTGDYLLGHRIPRAAQALLKRLPKGYAGRLLLRAIGRHTWTFAGSGSVALEPGPPVTITIRQCPLCRQLTRAEPVCDFYAATFERLYRTLVAPNAQARERACQAQGHEACVFEIRW
jgi:divinyl protochlorophyllide a 8-vinyl-reductase